MGQEGGFVAEKGEFQGVRGQFGQHFLRRAGSRVMGQDQLRNVPRGTWRFCGRWGTALLEMFLVEHGGAAGLMIRPGGPGDGCHGPSGLRAAADGIPPVTLHRGRAGSGRHRLRCGGRWSVHTPGLMTPQRQKGGLRPPSGRGICGIGLDDRDVYRNLDLGCIGGWQGIPS